MLEHNRQDQDNERVQDLLKALGRAYLENGEHQKAADKFRQLYENDPHDIEILMDFALTLARSEAIDEEALSVYRKAVESTKADKTLTLTLATLFLKENMIEEPALKVYRQSLNYKPPFEEEIRHAIGRVFHETTESITAPELRHTLMESIHNPEILSLYLSTVHQDGRFDEALTMLKDLYIRSNKSPLYLEAFCQTLLEKKAYAEANGLQFQLNTPEVEYCLKFMNIDEPIHRIKTVDAYLDFRNLFSALKKQPSGILHDNNEYELFILDNGIDNIDDVTAPHIDLAKINPNFDLARDFVEKCSPGQQKPIPSHLSAIGIFEITNYDNNPENSKLPFTTFINLICGELAASPDRVICPMNDGLIALGRDPSRMCKEAIRIVQKVARYNQVVEDLEIIHLSVTVHCSFVPFIRLDREGLHELRKAFKVHNVQTHHLHQDVETAPSSNRILVTDNIVNLIRGVQIKKLGEFKLPYYPNAHLIFELPMSSQKQQKTGTNKNRFGKYEVAETIKENEMYSTFRGFDPHLERPVVIKAYHAEAFAGYKEFKLLRKQFYEEVRKLNRINHPNVAVIYDAGEEGDYLYLVREFVDGKILNEQLLKNGPSDISRTLKFYIEVCKVLAHFHGNSIWHKNLKPDNIFITQQNEIKLT
ncbi:MAG: protein kinase, partial [bacterium]